MQRITLMAILNRLIHDYNDLWEQDKAVLDTWRLNGLDREQMDLKITLTGKLEQVESYIDDLSDIIGIPVEQDDDGNYLEVKVVQ